MKIQISKTCSSKKKRDQKLRPRGNESERLKLAFGGTCASAADTLCRTPQMRAEREEDPLTEGVGFKISEHPITGGVFKIDNPRKQMLSNTFL